MDRRIPARSGWGGRPRPSRSSSRSRPTSSRRRRAAVGLAGAVVGLLACSTTPTVLKVVSDPPGAAVSIGRLGPVGETPLDYTLTDRELAVLDKVAGERVNLPITLSMPAFLTERARVRVRIGGTYTHFVRLARRSEIVEITTEPEGVGVFQLKLDPEASPAARVQFEANPLVAVEKHGRSITRHFLGNTPLRLEFDPEHPLEQNDVLLFQKAGYHAQLGYFKEREDRIHMVMMPQVIEAR